MAKPIEFNAAPSSHQSLLTNHALPSDLPPGRRPLWAGGWQVTCFTGSMIAQAKGSQKSVYVILLNPAVAKHPKVLRQNPKRDPSKPCVYVGMTGLLIAQRFTNHKNGYKSSWVVKKYWDRLMPELYEHLNPMPYDAAVQMEKDLAEDLRNQGYTVTGGH